MNKHKKLLPIITIVLMTGFISEAQTNTGLKDSLGVKEQKSSKNITQEKSQGNDNVSAVKQVRSARPDMSRANGARPPSIFRQPGTGVPKGIGRPGGARRAGIY